MRETNNMMPEWMIKGLMGDHPYKMEQKFEVADLEKSLWIIEYNRYSMIPYDDYLDYKENSHRQSQKSITTALAKLIAVKHEERIFYRHEIPEQQIFNPFVMAKKANNFEFDSSISKDPPGCKAFEFDFSKQEDYFFITRGIFSHMEIERYLEELNIGFKRRH